MDTSRFRHSSTRTRRFRHSGCDCRCLRHGACCRTFSLHWRCWGWRERTHLRLGRASRAAHQSARSYHGVLRGLQLRAVSFHFRISRGLHRLQVLGSVVQPAHPQPRQSSGSDRFYRRFAARAKHHLVRVRDERPFTLALQLIDDILFSNAPSRISISAAGTRCRSCVRHVLTKPHRVHLPLRVLFTNILYSLALLTSKKSLRLSTARANSLAARIRS